jgi:hypothetical protein
MNTALCETRVAKSRQAAWNALVPAGDRRNAMRELLESISTLESFAKARLNQSIPAEVERLKLLNQLVRYGVCTCHCHFSSNVSHSAVPCCANAMLTAEKP